MTQPFMSNSPMSGPAAAVDVSSLDEHVTRLINVTKLGNIVANKTTDPLPIALSQEGFNTIEIILNSADVDLQNATKTYRDGTDEKPVPMARAQYLLKAILWVEYLKNKLSVNHYGFNRYDNEELVYDKFTDFTADLRTGKIDKAALQSSGKNSATTAPTGVNAAGSNSNESAKVASPFGTEEKKIARDHLRRSCRWKNSESAVGRRRLSPGGGSNSSKTKRKKKKKSGRGVGDGRKSRTKDGWELKFPIETPICVAKNDHKIYFNAIIKRHYYNPKKKEKEKEQGNEWVWVKFAGDHKETCVDLSWLKYEKIPPEDVVDIEGKGMVGQRVEVLWPLEEKGFAGKVTKMMKSKKNFIHVHYDDGDQCWCYEKDLKILINDDDDDDGIKSVPHPSKKKRKTK